MFSKWRKIINIDTEPITENKTSHKSNVAYFERKSCANSDKQPIDITIKFIVFKTASLGEISKMSKVKSIVLDIKLGIEFARIES
jgi:hypothetical protein